MTGWTIFPGYSGHAAPEEIWSAIERHAREMLADVSWCGGDLQFAKDYFEHVHVYGPGEGVGEGCYVLLTASGGGHWRDRKEDLARRFVREILDRLHSERLDASVSVS